MAELIVRNGMVYSEGRLHAVDLAVEGGAVEGWMNPGRGGAEVEVDAEGKWVIPGVIDAHFHCRAPAYPEREDFASGSAAAAAGGVTTFFEMPISTPGVYNGEVLRARRELAESVAHVDFGLYAAPGTLDPGDVESAAREGAIGYKIFLHGATPERADEFIGICITDETDLYRALALVARTGLVCSVHTEDEAILGAVAAELGDDVGISPADHNRHRPPVVEDYASAKVLALAGASGVKIHLAHMSTGYAAAMVATARARGIDASGETCPHYVGFDSSVMEEFGPFAKVNPPIRGGRNREALRRAIERGDVDVLVSDHSPFTEEEKAVGFEDIRKAPSGCPGVEMLVPYFLDQVVRGELPMAPVLDGLTINPARRFGIARQKGHLAPGADADFSIYDPEAKTIVDISALQSRSRASAKMWDGVELAGRLESTWLRGVRVCSRGRIEGRSGFGRMVRPGTK